MQEETHVITQLYSVTHTLGIPRATTDVLTIGWPPQMPTETILRLGLRLILCLSLSQNLSQSLSQKNLSQNLSLILSQSQNLSLTCTWGECVRVCEREEGLMQRGSV